MGISIDWTFAAQIITFLIVWAGLKSLLFDPMLGVLEERESRTKGNQEKASTLRSEAEALHADYEERIREVRHALHEQLEENRKAAVAEERQIVAAARDAAAAQLSETRAEVAAQIEQARAALRGQAEALAAEVADRVLGRQAA